MKRDVPILACVPSHPEYAVTEALEERRRRSRPSLYDEVFHLLRYYLSRITDERELRTILIVSAAPREGKTTVSYNLAKAAAAMGSRVLLVEGDLRRRSPVSALAGQGGPGLHDVLTGAAQMKDAIRSLDLGENGRLDILIASEVSEPETASEVSEPETASEVYRHPMRLILERAKAVYDLVLIDTPPLSILADAIPSLEEIDGMLVVARLGRRPREVLRALRDKLHRLDVPVLGIVANAVPGGQAGPHDGGYSYGSPAAEPMLS